jgi:hypothetical protein
LVTLVFPLHFFRILWFLSVPVILCWVAPLYFGFRLVWFYFFICYFLGGVSWSFCGLLSSSLFRWLLCSGCLLVWLPYCCCYSCWVFLSTCCYSSFGLIVVDGGVGVWLLPHWWSCWQCHYITFTIITQGFNRMFTLV